jgi:hypothetical protein
MYICIGGVEGLESGNEFLHRRLAGAASDSRLNWATRPVCILGGAMVSTMCAVCRDALER